MNKKEEEKSIRTIFINEAINLSKDLSSNSKIEGLFELLIFFASMLLSLIEIKKMLTWAETHLNLLKVILFLALTVKPVMILSVVLMYKLEKYETIDHEKFKKIAKIFVKDVLIIFYRKKEFIIYPLKFLIFQIYFMDSKFRNSIVRNEVLSWLLMFWVLLDSLFSMTFVLVKVTFLRRYKPNSDFFCKLKGNFEQTFLFFIVFSVILFDIAEVFYRDNTVIHSSLFITSFVVLFGICWIYFDEHPYLNRFTEHVMGQLLLHFTVFFFIHRITLTEDHIFIFELQILLTPVISLIAYNLIERQDSEDYLTKNHVSKIKYIKKIYVQGHKFSNEGDFIKDYGVIQKKMLERSNSNKFLNIWKLFSQLQSENTSKINLRNSSTKNFSKNKKSRGNLIEDKDKIISHQDIFKKLDCVVFDGFIEDSGRTSYSIFLKVMWMIKNDIILTKVFENLEEMKRNNKTLTDYYFYHYAKSEVSSIFKGIYYQSDLYFNNLQLNEEKKNYGFRENFNTTTKINIDINYGLAYKDRISEIVEMIGEFINNNKKFLNLLEIDKKRLSSMNDLARELYMKKLKIKLKFHELEKRIKGDEYIHLTPYFYFLYKCINLQRSASLIFKTHKNRLLNHKRFIDHHKEKFTQDNFFDNMVIFLISSSNRNFGEILETYGDTCHIRSKNEDLVGKHMNSLIMDAHIKPHELACEKFLNKKLNKLIEGVSKSYLKLPNTDYVMPVTFNRKIIPFVRNNFEFLIGTKYNLEDGNMYILLDDQLTIDAFSVNLSYLFENPSEILVKRKLKIQDLSQKLWIKISEIGKQEEGTRQIFTTSGVQNSFSITENEELKFDNTSEDFELGNFKLKFKNYTTKKILKKKFRITLRKARYVEQDFLYYVLVLVYCDNYEWKARKSVILGNHLESDLTLEKDCLAEEKNTNMKNKDQEEDFNTRRICEDVSLKKMNTSNYRFIKSMKEENFSDDDIKEENLQEKRKRGSILVIGGKYKKKSHEDNHQKIENNPNSSDEEIPILQNGNKAISIEQNQLLKTEKTKSKTDGEGLTNKKTHFKKFNNFSEDISSESEEAKDNTEIGSGNYSFKGTGSIFSTAVMHSHSKYYSFEDITERVPAKTKIGVIITLFILSCLTLVGFTFYLHTYIKTRNNHYLFDVKMRNIIMKHNSEMQNFYSNLLRMTAYAEGMIEKDRFKGFYFENSTVDVSNLEDYGKYQVQKYLKRVIDSMNDITHANYMHMVITGEFDWELLFDAPVTAYKITHDKQKVKTNASFIQDYVLEFTSIAYKMAQVDYKELKIDTQNLDAIYLRENLMNGFLDAFLFFREEFYKEKILGELKVFDNTVALYLLILTILMFSYTITSLIFVIRIKANLKDIYETMQTVTKRDLDERRNELESVEKILKCFKDSNYYEDFMGYKEKNYFNEDNTRTKKVILDKNYCFRLEGSFMAFFFCYFFKVLMAILIFFLFKRNMNMSIWLGDKQTSNLKVMYNGNLLFNAIKQRLVLGKETLVTNINIDKFMKEFNQDVQSNSQIIYEFAETGKEIDQNDEVLVYLSKMNSASLCEFTPVLKPFPEYCSKLDDGIPDKGLVQSFIRIISFQDDIIRRLEIKNLDPKAVLNDKEYIEMEYTYENVYLRAFIEIMQQMVDYTEEHLISSTKNTVDIVIAMVIFVVVIATTFIICSLNIFEKQLMMSAFSFQVLSINTVISNILMRHQFLKIFEVGKNDF